MLIVHVIVDLTVGGAELMLLRLVEAHAGSQDFRHLVISLRSKGEVGRRLEALGVEVEALGMNSPLQGPAVLWRLRQRIRVLRPDIVQTWMDHANLIGGLAARWAGYRNIIWGIRMANLKAGLGVSLLTSGVRRAAALLSSRLPARIVYVAEAARQAYQKLGYDPRRAILIPNGYALPPEVAPDLDRGLLRRRLAGQAEALLIGSAGRFNAQKDHRTFVLACGLLARQVPEARFLLAGQDIDSSNRRLLEWIEEAGLADRVHLLGQLRDMADFFSALDVYCLHSVGEAFPNVVAEAMAAGVPCVVTDVGDAALLVSDTGLVVPAADPQALADALRSLLAESPRTRAERGRRARARIAEHFSIDAIKSRYERLYEEVMRCGASGGQNSIGGAAKTAVARMGD